MSAVTNCKLRLRSSGMSLNGSFRAGGGGEQKYKIVVDKYYKRSRVRRLNFVRESGVYMRQEEEEE